MLTSSDCDVGISNDYGYCGAYTISDKLAYEELYVALIRDKTCAEVTVVSPIDQVKLMAPDSGECCNTYIQS